MTLTPGRTLPVPSSSYSSSYAERYDEQLASSPPPSSPKVSQTIASTTRVLAEIRCFLDNHYYLASQDLVLLVSYIEYLKFEKELNKPSVLTSKEVDSIRSAKPPPPP